MADPIATRRAKGVRRQRGSISAEEILGAALRLAREAGVDGLSMPKLAQELGMGITSIYWYFESKDELVEAMTSEVARQFEDRVHDLATDHWGSHLKNLYVGLRAALREDDLMCDLLIMRSSRLGLEALNHVWPGLEAGLRLMVEAGFSHEEALHNYFVFSHYTRGAVVLERQLRKAGLSTSAPTPVPDRYPLLAEASKRYNLRGVSDDAFEAGLQAILDGMQARLEARARA